MNYIYAFDPITHAIRYYGGIEKRATQNMPFRIVFTFDKAHLVKDSDTENILKSLNRFSNHTWLAVKSEDICTETEFTYCQGCNLCFTEKEKTLSIEWVDSDVGMFDFSKLRTLHINSRLNEPFRFETATNIAYFRQCKLCEKGFCDSCMRTKTMCQNCRQSRSR